jgi:hypothetical protein
MKTVNERKIELEQKIENLNAWLLNPANEKLSEFNQKTQERNYYVKQLIELEEYGE